MKTPPAAAPSVSKVQRISSRLTRVTTRSATETLEAGARLAAGAPGPRAFYLEGDLGAGKTVFAKGIARHYGVDPDQVTSPTFALVSRYGEGTRPVYHLDLYRIEEEGELTELGIEDMEEEAAVVIVEWPERLAGYRREDAIRVRIRRESDGARRIETDLTAGTEEAEP